MAFWQENVPFIKVTIIEAKNTTWFQPYFDIFTTLSPLLLDFGFDHNVKISYSFVIISNIFEDVYSTRVCKMVEWMDQLEMSIGKVIIVIELIGYVLRKICC